MPRLDDLLNGPHLRLPRPLDALSEQWSRLRPRVRMLAIVLLIVSGGLATDAWARGVDARWGGDPRPAVITTRTLHAGEPLTHVRTVRLPPEVVPRGALTEAPADAVVALALPRGAVVTAQHVNPRGAAVALGDGMRAVPVPTEPGWGVVAGGWVDVWTLGSGDAASKLVAESRPVVEVRRDPSGLTSLVGLADDEVEAVTSGLALGRVLLAHAPAPDAGP